MMNRKRQHLAQDISKQQFHELASSFSRRVNNFCFVFVIGVLVMKMIYHDKIISFLN